MKSSLCFLFLLLGSACNSIVDAAEDDHDHDHDHDHEGGHSCACEAEEFGFEINCTDKDAMKTALQALQTDGCATDCSEDTAPNCFVNYLIVQSHHDYCPEDMVPTEVEDGFHDYDSACTEPCLITRKAVEGAPTCPDANCTDSSGNDAYAALVEGGCLNNCSSTTCRDNFFTLRAVHDSCDHDTLSQAAEEGLHDLEVPCVAQVCNHKDSLEGNQLVCEQLEGNDAMGQDTSAAATATVEMLLAVVGVIAVVAAL